MRDAKFSCAALGRDTRSQRTHDDDVLPGPIDVLRPPQRAFAPKTERRIQAQGTVIAGEYRHLNAIQIKRAPAELQHLARGLPAHAAPPIGLIANAQTELRRAVHHGDIAHNRVADDGRLSVPTDREPDLSRISANAGNPLLMTHTVD